MMSLGKKEAKKSIKYSKRMPKVRFGIFRKQLEVGQGRQF